MNQREQKALCKRILVATAEVAMTTPERLTDWPCSATRRTAAHIREAGIFWARKCGVSQPCVEQVFRCSRNLVRRVAEKEPDEPALEKIMARMDPSFQRKRNAPTRQVASRPRIVSREEDCVLGAVALRQFSGPVSAVRIRQEVDPKVVPSVNGAIANLVTRGYLEQPREGVYRATPAGMKASIERRA